MSYIKQNFTTGQVLKASHLNYIENGISENADDIEQLNSNLINRIYPVGSIYMSVSSTSPATLFGGTWEQIKDRFLLSAGSTYKSGETGGAATETLTVSQIPPHNHYVPNNVWMDAYGDGTNDKFINPYTSGQNWFNTESIGGRGKYYTETVGGGQEHNNMPPYLTVYVWKRTA